MVARLRDLLANEEMDDRDRIEAQEALDTLTATAQSVSDDQREQAVGKLKSLASAGWWKLAAPVLTSLVSAELQRHFGLPPS